MNDLADAQKRQTEDDVSDDKVHLPYEATVKDKRVHG